MIDVQIGDRITLYDPNIAAQTELPNEPHEVEIMKIPQHPAEPWVFKLSTGQLFAIHTGSPITKVSS